MKRTLLSLVLLATAFIGAQAQTALGPVADKIRAQPLSLATQSPLVSLTPADKEFPRQVYTLTRTFAPDGSFTVDWSSERVQSQQTFRANGTLLAGKQLDKAKQISVEVKSEPSRSSQRTIITEKGVEKSNKKVDMKPGIALREELLYLNVQAWAAGIRDGLKLQSLSPDGGMVGDFLILYTATSDPTKLSDKYTYPAEFKAALAGRPNYVVADMMLQGVGSFFYPHHFYVVYLPTPTGLQFAAYFGEDPKNPVFQYAAKP